MDHRDAQSTAFQGVGGADGTVFEADLTGIGGVDAGEDLAERALAADAALEDALRRPLGGPELLIAPQAMETGR